MKEGNNSNVAFVILTLDKRVIWKNMLQQSMKEGNNSNVIFVKKNCFAEKGTFNKHVLAFHEGKKQFKCDLCGDSFGVKSS